MTSQTAANELQKLQMADGTRPLTCGNATALDKHRPRRSTLHKRWRAVQRTDPAAADAGMAR
jgi:hypothetical protein